MCGFLFYEIRKHSNIYLNILQLYRKLIFKYMFECWKVKPLAKEMDTCEETYVDQEKVARVHQQLAQQNPQEVAKIFKALADETRIQIAYALAVEDELCVCDAAAIINVSTATASHHLRLLRSLGIANMRKEGKFVYYSLKDECVKQLIQIAFRHQREAAKDERS